MRHQYLALTGLFLALASWAPLSAQDANAAYDQFAPKPVPPTFTAPSQTPPAIIKSKGDDNELLLPKLKGLVFVANNTDIVMSGVRKTATPIVVKADVQLPDPASFNATVAPFVNQKLTRGKLNDLITAIIVYYRKNDHPVIDVIVPQQDINSGIVQVLLLESRIGTIKLKGNQWFSDEDIRNNFRAQSGDRIISSDMSSDLNWANQNPFHTSDVVYTPGPSQGTTDVTIQTQDRFPARFYAGYEDSGNVQTGYDRYILGVNWGDAFHLGLGQQLNYQYTSSGNMRSLQAHSGSYVIPLPWHHTLTFFGDYITSEGEIPPIIAVGGVSYEGSMRYAIPLPKFGDYSHSVSLGFDHKYNDNSLEFGNVPLSTLPYQVEQFVLAYNGSYRDLWGVTSLDVEGYYSPGDIGAENTDTAFNASHTYASSNYAYTTVQLSRLTKLPGEWSLFLHGTFQASDGNLVPSEQLGFGGYDTIRGYDERELNSDEGYIFNVELRTPTLSIGNALGCKEFNDQLQLLAFYDRGAGYNHTPLAGEANHTTLSSYGGGLRFSINTNVSVRADYGFQLNNDDLDNLHGGRGDLGVTVSY